MDEISLKEHVYFDGRNFHGGVDFGDVGVLGAFDEVKSAKDALGMKMIMLKSFIYSFIHSYIHIFIHSLSIFSYSFIHQ